MTTPTRMIRARYHCACCKADGRWFAVSEDRVWESVRRRLADHEERCAAGKRKEAG